MPDLDQAIALETVDTLKNHYFTFFGVKPKQPRKSQLAEALAKGLSDSNQLKAYWQKLSDLEQAFIQESVFNYDGLVDTSRFEVKYGKLPEKPGKEDYWISYRSRLSDSVKLFFYNQPDRYAPKKIPDTMLSFLKQLIDKPDPDTLKTGTLPEPLPEDHKIFERERLALSELHSLLILLQDKQLKVSEKTGLASSATTKKVSENIHEYYDGPSCKDVSGTDSIVSYGWLRLLGNSKFCKQSKATLVPAKKTNADSADTIKDIWNQWVNNRSHDEFHRINTIKGQNGKGKRFFTNVVTRREAIIAALKECKVNDWVAFEDFSRFMFITGAELEITTAPEYLYIQDPTYGTLSNGSWDIMEARYLRCFLVEYAATLGLIDVVMAKPDTDDICLDVGYSDMECLSRYDGLQFLRLTPLGQCVLGLTDNYQSKETTASETLLTVRRHGRIVFGNAPTPWEQQFLSLYADQSKDDVWKLSRKKIMEALQIGGSISELRQFLLARETQPFLPEDCEGMLNQAKSNLDGVKIQSKALIITCKNQEIAELIVNDKTLSKWCQRLDRMQIVIPGNKEKTFRDSLNALGIGCS